MSDDMQNFSHRSTSIENGYFSALGNGYFSILGEDLTSKLIKTKLVRNYKKRDIISINDDNSNYILLIHSGLVKVLTYLLDGREFVVDTPPPGSVFGEIDILRRTPPVFEIHALTSCEIWALDGKIIRDAVATDVELSNRLLQYVSQHARKLEERLISLTSVSISFRLANTLLRLSNAGSDAESGRLKINISQHELASMLPASREKVNRCLREWERSRIVHLAPGSITITNPQALHGYALG